ncbi:MAG: hypothetical protein BroJett029_10570 [Alphaproteobacteria bacterium]|nr:MAG: hypothetical protein BroJett029_10570 [Alphaproteobacteria bacterium]
MPASEPRDIATMSFEEALDELQSLVRKLEKGESKLDEAIQQYERGAALKQHCEAKLREAQAKIEKIVMTPAGEIASEPADLG